MEITGKLIQLLPEVQGESARGPWVRGGFVIEAGEEYPRKVAFTTFGEERVAMVKNIPMGTMVQVTFNPESREFNERWYTDLRVSRVQPFVPGTLPPASTSYTWSSAPAQGVVGGAAPATPGAPAASAAPAGGFATQPPANVMPTAGEDDLPF